MHSWLLIEVWWLFSECSTSAQLSIAWTTRFSFVDLTSPSASADRLKPGSGRTWTIGHNGFDITVSSRNSRRCSAAFCAWAVIFPMLHFRRLRYCAPARLQNPWIPYTPMTYNYISIVFHRTCRISTLASPAAWMRYNAGCQATGWS